MVINVLRPDATDKATSLVCTPTIEVYPDVQEKIKLRQKVGFSVSASNLKLLLLS